MFAGLHRTKRLLQTCIRCHLSCAVYFLQLPLFSSPSQYSTKFLSCHRIFSSDIHFHILFILKYRGRGGIRKYSLLMKSQTAGDKWPYYALSYPIKSSLNPHNIRTVWRTLVHIRIDRGHPTRSDCVWRCLLRNLTIQILKPIPHRLSWIRSKMFNVDRQTGRQAGRQAGRQTDRQTGR